MFIQIFSNLRNRYPTSDKKNDLFETSFGGTITARFDRLYFKDGKFNQKVLDEDNKISNLVRR